MAVFETLRLWVGDRDTGAPAAPTGFAPDLPPLDDDDVEIGGEALVGASFVITYQDAKGGLSRRRITVRRIEYAGDDLRIRAHCHERNAYRMFLASRIREITDMRSGDVRGDPLEVFESLAGPSATARALRRCAHDLNALAYVGLIDGHFHEAEVQAACEYVDMVCGDPGIDHIALGRWITTLHPGRDAFDEAIDWLIDAPQDTQQRFLRYLKRLIEADEVLHPAEVELVMEIDSALHN